MSIKVMEFPRSERGNDPADHADDPAYAEALRERVARAEPTGGAPRSATDPATEDACALEFSRRHPEYRYTPAFGAWHCYDPQRAVWQQDTRLQHMTLIRALVRELAPEKLHKASAVAGVASLARSNPGVAMSADRWDANTMLLGTPGEVNDLRTGLAVTNPRECCITRQTAVRPAPPGTPTPRWSAFLERVTRHAPELIGYLQRIAGYALTGSNREQALFFANGPGGNGKGVFMNTLTGIMGDYAHVASGDLLLAMDGNRHPTDMASLRGKRFVTASELRPGARWDEQRLKSLTGGDPITARFMRQDEFTYIPQLTLVIAGNHRPSFAGVDEAIRRRLRLVPFTQEIPKEERDPELPEKLREEWPGILRWAIEGCLLWQREGLAAPASVTDASTEYLESEDSLGEWLKDRVAVRDDEEITASSVLFDDWTIWCRQNGGPRWTLKAFTRALDERGKVRGRNEKVRGFKGMELLPPIGGGASGSGG